MYIKIVRGKLIFFIHADVVSAWLKARVDGDRGDMTTTQFSELVLDVHSNEVLKCRGSIAQIIDGRFARPLMTITLDE
jgi:hypothetical protein